MSRTSNIFIVGCAALSLTMSGCGGHSGHSHDIVGDTITAMSSRLKLIDCGDYTIAEISVPWNEKEPLGKYAIIGEDTDIDAIPRGYTVINAPLERSVVFSSAYTSAICELGHLGQIKGIADGNYYLDADTVSRLIADGRISDVGSSMSPLIENVIEIEPDAILLSPYVDVSSTGLERLGVPMVWMADYLETDPLGRAEWILLLGELYGEREKAKDIFERTKRNYLEIKEKTKHLPSKPVVITEKPMSGAWYVPGGQSYIAKMIADAGGDYPWKDNNDSGSVPLDEAAVIDRGADADIWLIKDTRPYNVKNLAEELPRVRVLSPFPESIYFCNTLEVPYYNVIAFHPDRVLSDMAAIFHPDVFSGKRLEFYRHLE